MIRRGLEVSSMMRDLDKKQEVWERGQWEGECKGVVNRWEKGKGKEDWTGRRVGREENRMG